jgi:hypothetical protein
MMMEALCSSETSVLTRSTLHNIPDNGILRGSVKAYVSIPPPCGFTALNVESAWSCETSLNTLRPTLRYVITAVRTSDPMSNTFHKLQSVHLPAEFSPK